MHHITEHCLLSRAQSDLRRFGQLSLDVAAELIDAGYDVKRIENAMLDTLEHRLISKGP